LKTPNCYVFSLQNEEDEAKDSDVDEFTTETTPSFLVPGADNLTWDVGLVPVTSPIKIATSKH